MNMYFKITSFDFCNVLDNYVPSIVTYEDKDEYIKLVMYDVKIKKNGDYVRFENSFGNIDVWTEEFKEVESMDGVLRFKCKNFELELFFDDKNISDKIIEKIKDYE